MENNKILVTVLKGARVICLEDNRVFHSKKDFSITIIQHKMGFCYYKFGESTYKTDRVHIRELTHA